MKLLLITITAVLLIRSTNSLSQVISVEFGNGGQTIADFSNDYDQPIAGVFDYLNRSITMGRVYSGTSWNAGLMRLDANGYFDPTFSVDGKATYPDFSLSNAIAVAVAPDGKILVGGDAVGSDGTSDFRIFRTMENGDIDPAFGTNGAITINMASLQEESLCCLTVQSDGKILAGGFTGTLNNRRAILIRLNENGSLDNTFADNGIYHPNAITDSEYLSKIVSGPDNSLYLLVHGTENNTQAGIVIKLDDNGNYDNTFATNGLANLLDMGYNIDVRNIGIPGNNTIEIVGNVAVPLNSGCKIVLYLDGTPDTSFGTNGAALITAPSNIDILASYPQSNGKFILLVMMTELVIIRLNPDGNLDTSFGTDGIFTPNFSIGIDSGITAQIFNGDKITIIGGSSGFSSDFAVGCILLNEGNSITEFTSGKVNIYPNPSQGCINFTTDQSGFTQIEISDISGKKFFSAPINSFDKIHIIDLGEGIPAGIYTVRLKGSSGYISSYNIIRQ
jgi:uncharacterized delta-60 repeat protein